MWKKYVSIRTEIMLYAAYGFCAVAYDWSSGRYSTWTESRWAGDAINVRYFLVPPTSLEVRQSSTPLQLRKRTRHVFDYVTGYIYYRFLLIV